MTRYVSSGTLNPTHSLTILTVKITDTVVCDLAAAGKRLVTLVYLFHWFIGLTSRDRLSRMLSWVGFNVPLDTV